MSPFEKTPIFESANRKLMLILLLILVSALVAVLAAPKSIRDAFIARNFGGSKQNFRLTTALTLIFVAASFFAFAFGQDSHGSIPSAGGAIAFGLIASTSLAGIVFVQTRTYEKNTSAVPGQEGPEGSDVKNSETD